VLKRTIAGAVAAICALLFLIFAGVAIMLGSVVNEFSWALVLVPAVPLVVAGIGGSMAMKPLPNKAFGELRSQLGADAEALRMLKGQ
jgi:hypothetical protein